MLDPPLVEGAQTNDIIHYHYVERLFDTGEEFGKRFVINLAAYSVVVIYGQMQLSTPWAQHINSHSLIGQDGLRA